MNLSLLTRLPAVLDVYRKGKALANPGKWKAGAIAVELGAFLFALTAFLAAFGWIDTPLSQEQALEIGLGISTFAGFFSTHVHLGSSRKVGMGTGDVIEGEWERLPPEELSDIVAQQAEEIRRLRAAQTAPPRRFWRRGIQGSATSADDPEQTAMRELVQRQRAEIERLHEAINPPQEAGTSRSTSNSADPWSDLQR